MTVDHGAAVKELTRRIIQTQQKNGEPEYCRER